MDKGKVLDSFAHGLPCVMSEVAAEGLDLPEELAWLIARPGITAPIASATSLEQLQDLIEATKLELDQDSIELLNQASAE